MNEIDIAKWKRREHFEFFRKADLPFYNVNTNVDITGVADYAKERTVSFSTLLTWLTMRSLNRTENFKFRLRGEKVIVHDVLHPSLTYIKAGDDLFSLITVDYSEDIVEFDKRVRTEIQGSHSYFNLEKLAGRDDLVFISSMPWISFTGVGHTLSLKKDDAIPRVTWGKYFEENGKTQLPFNIQVNHMFVDGLHVGRFFEDLGQGIRSMRRDNRPKSGLRPL